MKIFDEATGKMLSVHEVQMKMALELCKKFNVPHDFVHADRAEYLMVYLDEQVENTPTILKGLRDIDDCVLDDGGKEFDRYVKEFGVPDLLAQLNDGSFYQSIDSTRPEILENVLETAQKHGIKLFVMPSDNDWNHDMRHTVKPR